MWIKKLNLLIFECRICHLLGTMKCTKCLWHSSVKQKYAWKPSKWEQRGRSLNPEFKEYFLSASNTQWVNQQMPFKNLFSSFWSNKIQLIPCSIRAIYEEFEAASRMEDQLKNRSGSASSIGIRSSDGNEQALSSMVVKSQNLIHQMNDTIEVIDSDDAADESRSHVKMEIQEIDTGDSTEINLVNQNSVNSGHASSNRWIWFNFLKFFRILCLKSNLYFCRVFANDDELSSSRNEDGGFKKEEHPMPTDQTIQFNSSSIETVEDGSTINGSNGNQAEKATTIESGSLQSSRKKPNVNASGKSSSRHARKPTLTNEKQARNSTSNKKRKCFKCPYCDYSTARSDNLNTHIRIHTGGKPYRCNRCGKRFSGHSNYKRHMKVHANDFPFHCLICFRGFLVNDDKNSHEMVCKKRRYECYICRKYMYGKIVLEQHMRTHTGTKPFRCVVCLNRFRHKNSLTRHLNCVHA